MKEGTHAPIRAWVSMLDAQNKEGRSYQPWPSCFTISRISCPRFNSSRIKYSKSASDTSANVVWSICPGTNPGVSITAYVSSLPVHRHMFATTLQ